MEGKGSGTIEGGNVPIGTNVCNGIQHVAAMALLVEARVDLPSQTTTTKASKGMLPMAVLSDDKLVCIADPSSVHLQLPLSQKMQRLILIHPLGQCRGVSRL